MRHIIIGDIHGCIDELKMLIQKLELQQDDHLYFIGDLIDRGPDSVGVVKYVKALSEDYAVVLILGNHEEKFLRYLQHLENKTGMENQMSGTSEFPILIEALSASSSIKSRGNSILPDSPIPPEEVSHWSRLLKML